MIAKKTSPAPAIGALARCIEVSVEGKEDPCDFEKRPACHCEARSVPPNTTVLNQGLPGFAAWADAPDDDCVVRGSVPGSCLLRGRDVRCTIGDDCTAVCDTWRARAAEEPLRAKTARSVAAKCAVEENACACIVDVQGSCFLGANAEADAIACDTPPDAAYRTWLERERSKSPPEYCNRGSCQTAPAKRAPGQAGLGLFAALGVVALVVTRAFVRRSTAG